MLECITPMQVYQQLLAHYGKQGWWPADTAFEMMIGAILTQNTSWTNVEKALHKLREANVLDAQSLAACDKQSLEQWIRPAGFFRQKSASLLELCHFYLEQGAMDGLRAWPMQSLRTRLLDIHGIGPETADSILLYGIKKTIFVVDSYTKRIFHRLGILPAEINTYDAVQHFFQQQISSTLAVYQELHALIVVHAKAHCRSKPQCHDCPVLKHCVYGLKAQAAHHVG